MFEARSAARTSSRRHDLGVHGVTDTFEHGPFLPLGPLTQPVSGLIDKRTPCRRGGRLGFRRVVVAEEPEQVLNVLRGLADGIR